jgi:hypothetical protein
MPMRTRLLGLAFAASDLLIEIETDGLVVFALGSGPDTDMPPEALKGRPLDAVLGTASQSALRDAIRAIASGSRSGTVEVLMTCGDHCVRRASVRLFQLPDLAPNISCAVQHEGPAYCLHDPAARPTLSPVGLLERAREILTDPSDDRGLAVAFVDIDGLSAVASSGEAGERVVAGVEELALIERCRSLGVQTIAEMIETQAVADILRDLGVDHGQGWLFGKAEAEPRTTLASVDLARRKGAVTAWA